MRRIITLVSLWCVGLLMSAQAPSDLDQKVPLNPKVRYGELSNGMRYYILKNKEPENRMELRLALNAGSMQENEAQQGLAHFCEHMCFNGTKNFKKAELVNYLESVGVKFGAHLNAYTSFDETVYMLQLPTDNEENVSKGFQILEDWAHNVSFEGEEIDKERGVVIEEWRLGQGADERMRQEWFPVAFNNSRYAERLPIGKVDILENFEYKTLIDFYKDWYRPNLMAVVAVGDFDVDEIEAKIKKHFSGIKNPANEKPREEYTVPTNKDLDVMVLTDKEARTAMLRLQFLQDRDYDETTVGGYREVLKNNIYNQMLGNRLSELAQSGTPPFSYAFSFYGSQVRAKDAYSSIAYMNGGQVSAALQSLITENRRVMLHGFTQGEYERAKNEYISYLETQYKERDKTESRRLVMEYVYHFLEGSPAPGITYEFQKAPELLGGIPLEEINELPRKWMKDKEPLIILTAPEQIKSQLPSADEIKNLYRELSQAPVEAYVDNTNDEPLISAIPTPGKVVATNAQGPYKSVELTLKNGAKVVYKKTDFKNDEINFRAVSWGGYLQYGDDDLWSARNITGPIVAGGLGNFNAVQLQKKLSGKLASVSPYVGSTQEGFFGGSSPKDLETMMQLLHLYFSKPRKDIAALNSYISRRNTFMQNSANDPGSVFDREKNKVHTQDHLWMRTMESADLQKISLDKAYEFFKDRFADPGNFTFIFVGNIDEKLLKEYAEKYIGSLPSKKREESYVDKDVTYPKGVIKKRVYKGVEPKSTINITFHGEWNPKKMDKMTVASIEKALSIRLRNALREDKGGTYGVGCRIRTQRVPKQEYMISIGYGCAPENVDDLLATTYDVINAFIKEGPTEEEMGKFRETELGDHELNLRSNRFWMTQLYNYYMGSGVEADMDAYPDKVKAVSAKKAKKLAKKMFDMDNYIEMVLMPETEKPAK